jgi:diguanylate cyclase (GGDEF)-like protein/PAS domain S-box-containing protein
MTLTSARAQTVPRRLAVLALILAALVAIGTLPSVANLDPPAMGLWFLVALVTVPALAGLACLHAAARTAGADCRAWRSFGLGCLLWILGALTRASYGWFGADLDFPSLADVFFSLTSVAFVFGIYHYSLEGSGGSRLQATNFAIAISAVLAIGVIIYFPPLLGSNLGPLGALVAFSYPVTWLATFAFCLICFSLYVEGQRTFPFLLILAAAGGAAAADLFYGYALLTDSVVVGDFYFTFWLASFVFLVWAALAHSQSTTLAATVFRRKATRPGEALIPALSVAAIMGAGLMAQWHHLGASVLLLVPPVAGFAAFIAMREHAIFASERNLRTRAERNTSKLAESEKQLSHVLDHTTDGVIVLDRELRIAYANSNAVAMHFSDRPYLGLPMWEVLKSSPDNEFYTNYRAALARQTPMRFEAHFAQLDRWFEDHVFPTPTGLTIFYRDVTERRRLREELVRLAQHDPLTGLANRALFGERLEQGLQSGRRHRDLVLVLIDLDGFKDVNDTLGHLAGDSLLQQFAGRLTSLVRHGDTVARFGGDEFAIIQPGPAEPGGGAEVARRVAEALRTAFDIYGTEVMLTASIGIAMAPAHGTGPNELIRKADLALYRAKRTKGAILNYCIFEPDMDDHEHSRQLARAAAKPRLGALPKPA